MQKFLTFALSLLGLFDSLYLWWAYTSASHPLVCVGTGCEVARASSYSHLWGLPLPLFGVAMYGVLGLLAFGESLAGRWLVPAIRYAVLVISGSGFIASLILSGIEAFVLHAWCAWCVLSAITITLILALAIYGVARPSPPPQGAPSLTAVRAQFLLLIFALIIGVPAFIHLRHAGEYEAPKPPPAATLEERLVRPDSHATGNLQSPVTVVEFGDFECPMCGLAQKTVQEMLAQYGSKIRFVFRQFPRTDVHRQAEKAAEASECAAQQGKFWPAEKLLYLRQSDLSVAALKRYATELGLDANQFDQCLSGGSMAARVRRDFEDGLALGVRGTPTFFVGRQMIVGVPNYSDLSQLIDEQLSASSAASAQGAPEASNSEGSSKPQPTAESAGSIQASSGGALGGGDVFSQIQAQSPLACSPAEARLQQPALIRTPEAQKLFQGNPKPLFVDVRSAQEFAAGHIAGAISLPVEDITSRWSSLPQDKVIIFYEGGERGGSPQDVCAFSRAAARVLLAHGFEKSRVKVYQDGLKGWEKAGSPVAR